MNEIQENLLKELKSMKVREELISEFPFSVIENACAAWYLSEPEIKEIDKMIDNPVELWSYCEFNKGKLFRLLKMIPRPTFIFKLMMSNLIYPDGDYNEEWLLNKRIIIQQQNKGAGHGRK